jgi:low affinity Fe/Cu permease
LETPILIGEHDKRSLWRVLNERFRAFAHQVAMATGSPWAFTLGVAGVILWALTGRWFGYSEAWQLVINTSTTIVTFLMVFILQNTQARDSRELHVKLDELLRAVESARNDIIRCSELSDEQLDQLHDKLRAVAVKAVDETNEPGKIVVERETQSSSV